MSVCLSHTHSSGSARWAVVLWELVAAGLSAVGAAFGILSIVLARPGQRSSIMPRAVSGLVLLGLLAAIAVPNFVRARALALERRQALSQVHTAAADLRAKAATSLTNGKPGSAVDFQPLRRSLSQAAEKSSGETAALLKSSEQYLGRIQPLQQAYSQTARELAAAHVLSPATLQQRTQIQERRALVQKFLDANSACKAYLMHAEANYSNQLASAGVSAAQMEIVLREFRKNSAQQTPLVLKIREADERAGKAMLTILQVFDREWGQWKYDESAHVVRFQNPAASAQYNELMTEVKQAGQDETATSKRLSVLMSGGSVRSVSYGGAEGEGNVTTQTQRLAQIWRPAKPQITNTVLAPTPTSAKAMKRLSYHLKDGRRVEGEWIGSFGNSTTVRTADGNQVDIKTDEILDREELQSTHFPAKP